MVVNPFGLAVDGNGNLYVAGRFSTSITKIAPDGTLTPFGTASSAAAALAFHDGHLFALAVDGFLLSFDSAGVSTVVTHVGNTGSIFGGLVFDSHGNLFTANNQFVEMVTPGGAVSTVHDFGSGLPMVPARGIAIDSSDNLFVSDFRDTIWKITPDGTTTFFANGSAPSFMVIVPEPSSGAVILLGIVVAAI